MPKPSVVPNWATSATGLTRRTDPAGSADDGLEPGDRWPAQWHNFQLGLLGDWAQYLDDQDFEGLVETDTLLVNDTSQFDDDMLVNGDVTIGSGGILQVAGVITGSAAINGQTVSTQGADIIHGTKTMHIGASSARVGGGFATWITPDNYAQNAASGSGSLSFTIPLSIGDRIKEVRVICNSAGATTTDISARLDLSNKAVGGASTDSVTNLVASTDLPAGVSTIQAIVLNPTDTVLATGHSIEVTISAANSSGNKNVFRIEVDYDRPS